METGRILILVPVRSYCLQIQTEFDWISICHYSEDHLEEALASCRRAVFVEKVPSRVVEREEDYFNVVLEIFYNRDDEGFEISWKHCGF